MTIPKKSDPLNSDEMTEAAEIFFPLFNIVHTRMPDGSTTEDCLKVMESVAKLGHKNRADRAAKEKDLTFGFNQDKKDDA